MTNMVSDSHLLFVSNKGEKISCCLIWLIAWFNDTGDEIYWHTKENTPILNQYINHYTLNFSVLTMSFQIN